MSTFKPPESFVPGTSPAEAWDRWRLRFEIYSEAADLASKTVTQQRAILLHVLGDSGLELYSTLTIPEVADLRTVQVILTAISNHYTPYRNTTFKRHLFFSASQTETQTIDDFTTELKSKGRDCEFGDLYESLIRDRLICGIKNDALRERLLREPNLTLGLAIDICRADENSKLQSKAINTSEPEAVHAVTKYYTAPNQRGNSTRNKTRFIGTTSSNYRQSTFQQGRIPSRDFSSENQNNVCTNCLRNHLPRQCPAFGNSENGDEAATVSLQAQVCTG